MRRSVNRPAKGGDKRTAKGCFRTSAQKAGARRAAAKRRKKWDMTGLPFGDPSMADLNGKATPEIGRESEIC